jgi:hypothetical protein
MLDFLASLIGKRVPNCGQVKEIRLQSVIVSAGASELGCLKCDGDRYEETGFGRSGTCDDCGFDLCGRYGREGHEGAAAGTV